MSRVTVNLNNYTYVKLTDIGRRLLIKHWMGGDNPYQSREEAEKAADTCSPGWRGNDWVKFQLHEVGHIFGTGMFIGFDVPIETEIQIEVE